MYFMAQSCLYVVINFLWPLNPTKITIFVPLLNSANILQKHRNSVEMGKYHGSAPNSTENCGCYSDFFLNFFAQRNQLLGTYLEVDHVPEALQITAGHFLQSCTKLTVVDKAGELLEPLSHQQLRLTYCCPDAATYYNDSNHINHS